MKTIKLPRPGTALLALALALSASAASALEYEYIGGHADVCTSTCDSFASLTQGSSLEGSITLTAGPGSFSAADVVDFEFEVLNPGAPLEPYTGANPTTANPLPVDSSVAVIEPSNTAGTFTTGGTIDANGDITDGTILFRFTVPPFSSNSAWVIFDLGTGEAKVCLFFDNSGCIPAATETVVFNQTAFAPTGGSEQTYKAGAATLCTNTCDSFASLDVGSELTGTVDINVAADSPWSAADITGFGFLVTNPGAPLEPYNGTNPTTANPLPVDASVAVVEASNTAGDVTTGGTLDAAGNIESGTILFRFTVPPFNSNDAWVIFDVRTGTAQVCLFFDTAGCIPGATRAVVIETPTFLQFADSDGDGVSDTADNCLNVPNPTQRDTDGDGHGNACDADFNGDCVVNPIDLGIFRSVFFTSAANQDLNGDGIVNPVDLGIFRSLFFMTPGPSAPPNACGNL